MCLWTKCELSLLSRFPSWRSGLLGFAFAFATCTASGFRWKSFKTNKSARALNKQFPDQIDKHCQQFAHVANAVGGFKLLCLQNTSSQLLQFHQRTHRHEQRVACRLFIFELQAQRPPIQLSERLVQAWLAQAFIFVQKSPGAFRNMEDLRLLQS